MRPSWLSRHDSARLLPILCPGYGRTRASWRAYNVPNGVICGGAVDGSNQLGAMVTCQAITACPDGLGWADTCADDPTTSTAATSSRHVIERRRAKRIGNGLMTSLLGASGHRIAGRGCRGQVLRGAPGVAREPRGSGLCPRLAYHCARTRRRAREVWPWTSAISR